MANGLSGVNLKSLGVLWDVGTFSGLDDRELLARFVERRDGSAELAFEVLVRRHGPMVLGVCRSLLHDHHAADDAFQAVFLVLARKARSIRKPAQLGSWLHGVALRTARESRKQANRRRKLAEQIAKREPMQTTSPDQILTQVEEAEVLHAEIARLPERYRVVVVLCDLEGLTQDEAATQLRCPIGTVAIRLKRGRERLRGRLTRRGLSPPNGMMLAFLRPELAPGLIDAAVKVSLARGCAAASVVSLVEGVRTTMNFSPWKMASSATMLALALAATWAVSGVPTRLEPDDPPPLSPREAAVQPVARESGEVLYYNGWVGASRRVQLRSRVIGVVENVLVEKGSRFKANDVLFEIDPKPYQAALEKARVEVERAEAGLKLAKEARDRNARLREKDPTAITQAEIERTELALIASTEARNSAAQDVARAEENLAATRIKAPFAGTVFEPTAQIGDPVRPDSTVLTTIAATDPVEVAFDVDETTFLKLRRRYGDDKTVLDHLVVQVGLVSEGGFPHRAALKSLPDRFDPSKGTASFRATIPNPDQVLLIDSFVRIRLTLADTQQPSPAPRAATKVDAATDPKAVVVRAIGRAVTRDVRDYEDFAGKVEAFRGKIQPQIVGTIAKVRFPDGGPVKDKDLLFEIDAGRRMEELRAEIAAKKATLPGLKVKAEVAAEALKKFEAEHANRPQPGQEEKAQRDRLAIENQQAQNAVSIANVQIQAMSGELQQIPSLTQIRSTFDGNLDRPQVKVGDMLETTQTVLATYEATDRLSVAFEVSKPTFKRLNVIGWYQDEINLFDDSAQVVLADVNPFPLRAHVENSPKVIDPVTGAYRLKATIRDRDRIVVPGMNARVRLNLGRAHETLLVPESAIATEGNQNRVYLLDKSDIVQIRPVQVGQLHGGFREIIEGLKPGDRVVVEDLVGLKSGMIIKPRPTSESDR